MIKSNLNSASRKQKMIYRQRIHKAHHQGWFMFKRCSKVCASVLLVMLLMMILCAETASAQQQRLTETELRQLLRASLDREQLLNDRLDAAAAHIKDLEYELAAAKVADDADKDKITNLQSQVNKAADENKTLRDSIDNYKASIQALKEAVALRDKEVTHQQEKVKAANKRTVYAVIGSVILTALAFLR
jgi:septal ring factor EnvC (AmiA/AmiB activator)